MATRTIQHDEKRAAIYDRWLHTLGGGEQVAFSYAEVLRDLGYKTEILTHKKINLDDAEKKMNLDLHGISIRYLPNLLDYQLSEYTEEYDVFVSNSFLDYIPNRSKFGILSVFFPSRIKISMYEYLKRAHIVPSLRRFFVYPTLFEGFRYDEQVNGRIFKWLGKESTIHLNQHVRNFSIRLWIEYIAFSCVNNIQFRDGDRYIEPISRTINHSNNVITYNFRLDGRNNTSSLSISLPDSEYASAVALLSLRIPGFRYTLYNIFKAIVPTWEMRLHGGPSVTKFSDIDSYDRIVAISKFTQKWIKQYWGIRSDLLYPSVDVQAFKPATNKKNMIVHVGRFFLAGHSKKQLDMLRVFKRMVDKGLKGWELHFIGSVADGRLSEKYVETIREELKGYPVFLHLNASFSELQRVVSESKIYWHATGLDEDNQRYPIRLEHFGITTVEAMASGCVPVVIRAGGQTEIVESGISGYLWNTREELMSNTLKLIKDPVLLAKMRKEALQRSAYFSRERFKKELRELLPHA